MTHYYYDSKANKFYGPLDRMPPTYNGGDNYDENCYCQVCRIHSEALKIFHTYLSTMQPIPHTFSGHSRVVTEGEIEWRYEMTTWKKEVWYPCSIEAYNNTQDEARRRVATPKITEGEAQPIGTFEYDIENGKVKYEPNPNCSLNASQPPLTVQPDKPEESLLDIAKSMYESAKKLLEKLK